MLENNLPAASQLLRALGRCPFSTSLTTAVPQQTKSRPTATLCVTRPQVAEVEAEVRREERGEAEGGVWRLSVATPRQTEANEYWQPVNLPCSRLYAVGR